MANIEITSNKKFTAPNLAISEEDRKLIRDSGEALRILNTHENSHTVTKKHESIDR